jgi:hypothetical protein
MSFSGLVEVFELFILSSTCEMHGVVTPSLEILIFPIRRSCTSGTKRFVRRGTLTVITCAFQVVSVRRLSRFQRR